MLKKMLDPYFYIARLFPTVLISIPMLVLLWRINEIPMIHKIIIEVFKVKIVGDLTLTVVLWYALSLIVRYTARHIENEVFLGGKGFPSTYLMLYNDKTYSEQFKNKFRKRIKTKFKFNLSNKQNESKNFNEAKKRLDESMGFVRESTRGDKMLLNYNSWYGFYRNLSGGIFYSIIFCFLNFIVFGALLRLDLIYYSQVIILTGYTVFLFFCKKIIVMSGEDYAKQLHRIFMCKGSKNDKK
jgi:hypothetical protein